MPKGKEMTAVGQIPETFDKMFSEIRELSMNPKYSSLPMDSIERAFTSAATISNIALSNPYLRNTRLKRIPTAPAWYERDDIERMLKDPLDNEQGLRATGLELNYSSYPFYKLNRAHTDMLTFRWFYRPAYLQDLRKETDKYKRERQLVDKLCKRLQPKLTFRTIAQRSVTEGKVVYYRRSDIDKSHNRVNVAVLQELPSDYVKIVGRNSVSYWTVAFNFAYFWEPGTCIDDYPPIFRRYYDMLNAVTDFSESAKNGRGRYINFVRAGQLSEKHPEIRIEKKNTRYFFWVTLPIRECWVFGVDFSTPLQAPAMMGLFLTMQDLQSYEYLQQQLTQVPLYAFLSGEIPYFDDKTTTGSKKMDATRMSPQGYDYFKAKFYEMIGMSGTQGLDIFAAPLKNMQLHQLQEVPNSNGISTAAYQQFLTKAWMSGIMSTSDKPTASMVNASQKLEPRNADLLYDQFGQCMNIWFEDLGLESTWLFKMFGNIYIEKELNERYKNDLTVGLNYELFYKLALEDMTLQDAIDMSGAVKASGVYKLFENLSSTFNTPAGKQKENGEINEVGEKKHGRPRLDIEDVVNENTELTIDRRAE